MEIIIFIGGVIVGVGLVFAWAFCKASKLREQYEKDTGGFY